MSPAIMCQNVSALPLFLAWYWTHNCWEQSDTCWGICYYFYSCPHFLSFGYCVKLNYCKKNKNKQSKQKKNTSKREKLLFLMVFLTKAGPWVVSLGWNGWGINILINTLVSITTVTFAPACHIVLPKLFHSIVQSNDSLTTTKQTNRGSAIQLLFLKELALPYSDILKLLFLQRCFVHGCPYV